MKVIVNHFLDPRIVLVPNVGNDRSWVWVAFDFADGELVETVRLMTLLLLACVHGPSSRRCWMYLSQYRLSLSDSRRQRWHRSSRRSSPNTSPR